MPEGIATSSCRVEQLFSGDACFILPYFQRGYAWQDQHVLQLLRDIQDCAEGRRGVPWYPLGTIILARNGGTPETWLTDGHQRLMTLTILIAILRDLETDPALKTRLAACIHRGIGGGKTPEARLLTQATLRSTMQTHVQNVDATRDDYTGNVEDLPDSDGNIIINRDVLRRRLRELTPEACRKLAEYVLSGCILFIIEVESREIAQLLFTKMHNTGIRPSSSDIFKAQVLGAIDDDNRDAAQASWELLEASLGSDRVGMLLHQLVVIADRKQPDGPIEQRLDEIYGLGDAVKARDFVKTRVAPVGNHLARVVAAQVAGQDAVSPMVRQLRYLSWVRHGEMWLPPTLHWLDRHGDDHPTTLDFLRRIEALAWTQMIRTVEADKRDRRYMTLIDEISAGKALEAGGALTITAEERDDVRRILAGPNFIRRKYKQFLLLRIDAALRSDGEGLPPPVGTIEHIFPNRPAADSSWQRDFKGKEASVLRQMLGNLTLLTTAEQDIVKNSDFAEKRNTYRQSLFRITRRLDDRDGWTPADVKARTDALVDLILGEWRMADAGP